MFKKLLFVFQIIISIPKTIYFNVRVFNLSIAVKMPVFVWYNVKLLEIYKNSVIIDTKKIKPFMIKIGIGGSNAIKNSKSLLFLSKNNKGEIYFKEKAKFSNGITLYVNGGKIEFGNDFSCNKNCFISSDNKIIFGDDVLIGWNVTIRDSDGHKILYKNKKERENKVIFGNHVWICSCVDVLKNTNIGDDCVIGYKSLVTNLEVENNKLVAGMPAKIIKENINWEK